LKKANFTEVYKWYREPVPVIFAPFFKTKQSKETTKGETTMEKRMNRATVLVKAIKAKGFTVAEAEFKELFQILEGRTIGMAKKYMSAKNDLNLPFDSTDLVASALGERLITLITLFDLDLNDNFEAYYFSNLYNGFSKEFRRYSGFEQQSNVNAYSLDVQVSSDIDEGCYKDTLEAKPETGMTDYSEEFEEALEAFSKTFKKGGEEAVEIIKCHGGANKTDDMKAICELLGIEKYDSSTRKKVQRIKDKFKVFYTEWSQMG